MTVFLLRAYLIVVFGDIPTISMIMRMKGHNGCSPCHMCEIQGIRIPSSQVTTHYVLLHRENFPDSQHQYDATALPLRNHASFMEQAQEVQSALTNAASEQLATKYGIKGLPLLSALSSLSFPVSFPYDFMHLIWANLIPNLILLWTGKFKDLDHNDEGYVLVPKVWQAIRAATLDAGKTIPAMFGSRVPNIAAEKPQMTAETHSIWTLYLTPTLLNGQFINEQYYKHFIQLVQLLMLCLEFEITQDQIDDLERGFQEWVEEYEQYKLLSLPDAI
jgi:hypothetical protein